MEDAPLVDSPMKAKYAKPLQIQQLELALQMGPFMKFAQHMLSQSLSSDEDSAEDQMSENLPKNAANDEVTARERAQRRRLALLGTKEERQRVKMRIYNLHDLTSDREWLYELLMSDTDTETEYSDEDDYVKDMLRMHMRQQKYRENFYKKTTNTQYAYYGAGMLSNTDMYPDHQQSVVGIRKRKRRTKKEKPAKLPKPTKPQKIRKRKQKLEEKPEDGEIHPSDLKHYAFGDTVAVGGDDEDDFTDEAGSGVDVMGSSAAGSSVGLPMSQGSIRGRRRKSQQQRTPEMMAARRRRVWQLMAKKEIGRCQRARINNHKEALQNCKRVATMCMKVVRQRAMISQKVMKETVWRAKRLTREMLSYWKRYERVERDNRRRMEREAEEQRKMDVEIIEAKRQQRKFNFLITQTELYAHFMSKKLGQGTEEDQLRILNQLDEEVNPRLAVYDDYNAEQMKLLAVQNAEIAFDADSAKVRQFKAQTEEIGGIVEFKEEPEIDGSKAKADLPQPEMFQGTLKAYQIKGMTWLANLYDQGISGILADEMGLGKTVQSIAFLCHIAERYGVWGPFLVISPASTLHNWQQEMQRFVPDFNVVPYWGSPNERKILRQFWEQKDLHTKEASFHVVITSYQLIVSDYKYFNRIKWQYMVLDEAQAIKSATSMRWKLLLGFNCRNRLLLSGTPIQNSMAELWALLHFIMPTLFDSHDEFNEWFSKDIESHAENKTGIDEKQISRLHMILKPFMLRRIKKDVENELSDKIEIMVYCPLTIRQKLLYMALKKKIRIEDLLHLARGGAGATGDGSHVDRNFTSNLMNLVMQFRKVCNHPELFERRNPKSSFIWRCEEYVMPRLVYDEGILSTALPSKRHLVYNKLCVYIKENVQRSIFKREKVSKPCRRYIDLNLSNDTGFDFTRLCDLSPQDMEDVTVGGFLTLIQNHQKRTALVALLAYRLFWWPHYRSTKHLLLEIMAANPLNKLGMLEDSILKKFLFTGLTTNESTIYAFGDYTTVNIQETFDHRLIRSKAFKPKIEEIDIIEDIKIEVEDDEFDSPRQLNSMQLRMGGHMDDSKLLPEFRHTPRKPQLYFTEPLEMPKFLYGLTPRVQAVQRSLYCNSRAAAYDYMRHIKCENAVGYQLLTTGLALCKPDCGWSFVNIPDKQTLISDAGKLAVLDSLLKRLKAQGHRVLIYSQMTKMIDLLEEYMWHRKHRYMRLDGSSKISARRDMVADFQTRSDIFVFLLSTRAGGLGINLTAADTVIFYDSDWNPTVDQQAMDRAHRLGQTKQVTVYRLICKGTIEERILQRAREKSEIQRMVISGGNFKPDTLKPKEVVSLLLDDEEIEMKYRQKAGADGMDSALLGEKRKRTANKDGPSTSSGETVSGETSPAKRFKLEMDDDSSSTSSPNMAALKDSLLQMPNDDSDNETLIVDCDNSMNETESSTLFGDYGIGPIRRRHHPRGTKRGRPRGTSRRGGGNGSISRTKSSPTMAGHKLISADGEDSTQHKSGKIAASEGGFPSSALPSIPVKRGPGRPRLKTAGPPNQGTRGAPRTRKPIGPLMVPLGSSPAATPVNRSPVYSPAPSPAHSSPANTTTVHSSSSSSTASSTVNSQTGIDSTEQ